MLRKYSVLMAVAAMFTIAAPVQAQIYLGPEVAWNDDADIGIGAGVEVGLASLLSGLSFYGDFLFHFPSEDGLDYWEGNGNAKLALPIEGSTVLPFALAGVNFANVGADFDCDLPDELGDLCDAFDVDGTEVGFNLGGGIEFDLGSVRPQVSARAVLGGWETFNITAFLPFQVSN